MLCTNNQLPYISSELVMKTLIRLRPAHCYILAYVLLLIVKKRKCIKVKYRLQNAEIAECCKHKPTLSIYNPSKRKLNDGELI
jgi:hypothetical protein